MNNLKKEFLAFISHKLLTPATIIKWNAELLKRDLDSKDYEKISFRLDDIIKSNNKQIDFVSHFLNHLKVQNDLNALESVIMQDFPKKK